MSDVMNAYKVNLSSGKVIVLQEMQIAFEDLALRAVGDRAGKNDLLAGKMMQDELIKILIIEIDGKKLTGTERESVLKSLSYGDILQIRKVVQKLMGTEGEALPNVEIVNLSGDK